MVVDLRLAPFPEQTAFDRKIQPAELDFLASSRSARTAFTESYVGIH